MSNFEVLDNVQHRDLQVAQDLRLNPQDGLGYVQVFPSELDAAHKEYPVFFRKNSDTGKFFLVALLADAFTSNAYLKDSKWTANYIPLMVRRGPFLMARVGNELSLCLNLADERVNKPGERLFDDSGTLTPYAESISKLFSAIHQGHEQADLLVTALSEHGLIEALEINDKSPSSDGNLSGLYSVNPKKLRQLTGDALAHLNGTGLLQLAYFIASSSANIRLLLAAE